MKKIFYIWFIVIPLSLLANPNEDLLDAAIKGDLVKAQTAIKAGADVNAKNNDGMNALIISSLLGNFEIAKLLVENKADVNVKNNDGQTALMISSLGGYLEIAKLLVENKADVNAKDNDGHTALIDSSMQGYLEITRLLIKNKADVSAKNNYNNTPLIIASLNGHLETVKLLIENKADVKDMNAALKEASWKGYLEIVKLLIENKADIHANDEDGKTALDIALEYNKGSIIKLLFPYTFQFQNTETNNEDIFLFFRFLSQMQKLSEKEQIEIYLHILSLWENDKIFQKEPHSILIWFLHALAKSPRTKEKYSITKPELIGDTIYKKRNSNPLHGKIYYLLSKFYSLHKDFERADQFLTLSIEKGELFLTLQSQDKDFAFLRKTSMEKNKGILFESEQEKKNPKFYIQNGPGKSNLTEPLYIAYSPDGKTLVTTSAEDTKIWSINGRLLHTLEGAIYPIAYSTDSTIATASTDNTAKIWSINGRLLYTLEGHTLAVNQIAYSPDGKTLATASWDNTAKIWSAEGQLLHTLEGHTLAVKQITYSPNGKTLATASTDKTVKIWSLDGQLLHTLEGHTLAVNQIAYSPDGKTLATASTDNTAKIWSIDGQLLHTLEGHTLPVNKIAYSPDGKTIATASEDKTAKIWSIDGQLLHTLEGHTSTVKYISYSPDGKTLATTASYDTAAIIWSIDGRLLYTLGHNNSWVQYIAYSPDSKTIATSSYGTVKIWSIFSGSTSLKILLRNTLEGYTKHLYLVVYSPDGNTFASLEARNRTVEIWSINGQLIHTLKGHLSSVNYIAYSPDGKTLATASRDKTAKIWSLDGQLLHTLRGHSNSVSHIAYSPDGKTIATASWDKTAKIWSIGGRLLHTLEGYISNIDQIIYSPDGKTLATTSEDNKVKIWSIEGGLLSTLENDGFGNIAYSPDGKSITTAGNTVKIWSIDGRLLYTLDGASYPSAYLPDGRLVTGSRDNTAKIWSIDGRLLNTLEGHTSNVSKIISSLDGIYILTGSFDNRIIIWDISKPNPAAIHKLKSRTDTINSMQFIQKEKILVTSSSDNTIKYWDWKKGELLYTFIPFSNGEWFTYTPDNYFDASANGAKYMNIRKENEVFGVDQFAIKLNRPDILLKRMKSKDQELISFYHKKYKNRIKKYIGKPLSYNLTEKKLKQVEEKKLSNDFHVPNVDNLELSRIKKEKGKLIPTDKDDRSAKFVKLTFKISDTKEKLKSYNIFINDVPVYPEGKDISNRKESTINIEEIVELTSGENKIEVSCMNQKGTESFRDITFADYDGKEKGNLYFIGFGVSKYKDKRLNLKYADKDIQKQLEVFKKMEGTQYNKVKDFTFVNKAVTVQNIKKIKEKLKDITVDDTVILSISGHGAHERKEKDPNETYYFITYNTDINNLKKTAADFELIEDILEGTKENPLKARKKLFFMDTCESGEIDDDTRQSLEAALSNNETAKKKGIHLRSINLKNGTSKTSSDQNGKESAQKQKVRPYVYEKDRFIHNDLFRRTGAIVFSSSRGGEFSQEQDDIESGVFSYSIINALKYDSEVADKNKDGYISIEELKEYLMKSVPEQTSNTQHPTVDRDNLSLKILFPVVK